MFFVDLHIPIIEGAIMEIKELFYIISACFMLTVVIWDSRNNKPSA